MRGHYFVTMSLVLLALTLVAFSDNLFTNVRQPSNSDPKFIVHGLFALTWMVLLVVQTVLVRRGGLRVHRSLGLATMVVALGVSVSTVFVFWAVWKGWAATALEARANRLLLPGFWLLVWLGYRHRARPDWHKRLMLIATFFMMGPVFSRAYDPILVNPFMGSLSEPQIDAAFVPLMVIQWVGLFASLGAFDWREARRIHPATACGLAWFGLSWVVARLS